MKKLDPKIVPLKMKRDKLLVLNQILLPIKSEWVECTDEVQAAESIKVMHVRGAPAIGVTAAYGFYLGARKLVNSNKKPTIAAMEKIKDRLDKSRPTAVNLFWATNEMMQEARSLISAGVDSSQFLIKMYNKAVAIHEDDANRCLNMSEIGANFVEKLLKKKQYNIMTHCNAGALATGGIGTAVGLIRVMNDRGKVNMVYANETRPYLQGARLTAFELEREKIPATLVVDSMAATLMRKKMIDFIIVGADRISKNGDVANKIGTYGLSVLAKEHKIPFFVIAPRSTFDANIANGDQIPIEERSEKEVLECQGHRHAAKVKALNYSFDVTPNKNITAIFFEDGVMS